MNIDVIHFKDGTPRHVSVDRDDLDALQALVGGLIEPVRLADCPLLLVCNEEAKIRGIEVGAVAMLGAGTGRWAEPIAGDFFIVRQHSGAFMSVKPGDDELVMQKVRCKPRPATCAAPSATT